MDRADVAFAAKELCRDFATPTNESVENLKKVARYLRHHPRLVYNYDYQAPSTIRNCYVDTDVAGCMASWKSTSGGIAVDPI